MGDAARNCHPVGSQRTHKVHHRFGSLLIPGCRCRQPIQLPNAFFIDDPAVVSDKRLDGWSVSFFEDCCDLLTFRHNFNLEASDLDPNLGFDGGVLELSTDGGNTFQDILAVGGGFVSGGYNRIIATDRGSPIAGRQAWSGNSGGFITTVVGLPSNVLQGRLRWRMASDNSGGNEGWRVDTFHMTWCRAWARPVPLQRLRRHLHRDRQQYLGSAQRHCRVHKQILLTNHLSR